MAREEYNACMVPWIKGKEGLDRKMSFCAGAKLCSGKAQTLEEAKQICEDRFAAKKGFSSGGHLFNCKCFYDYDKEMLLEALSLIEDPEKIKRAGELKTYISNTPNCPGHRK